MAGKQDFHDFVKKTGHRLIFQTACIFGNRQSSLLFHFKAQLTRQTDGAKNTDRIFLIAFGRIAYHHQFFIGNISHALMEIPNFLFNRVVIQRIASKVAAHGIFFNAAVSIVLHNAALRILLNLIATAKRRHFNDFGTNHHMDDLKAAADNAAAAEYFTDLLRCGIGCNIKIFGFNPEQQIPNGSPYNISLKTGFMQAFGNFLSGKAQHIRMDTVLLKWDNFLFGQRLDVFFRQHFMQPFF